METTLTNHRDRLRRDRRYAGVATVLLLALFCFPAPPSDLPGRFDHLLPAHFDKWVHGGLFAAESTLLYRWFRHGAGPFPSSPVASAWGAAAVLALSSEGLQHFVPGRFAEGPDLLADLAGVLLWHLGLVVKRRRLAFSKSSLESSQSPS